MLRYIREHLRVRTLFYVLIVVAVLTASFIFHRERASYNSDWHTVKYTNTKSLPDDIVNIKDTKERKDLFIRLLLPLILKANEDIKRQRDTIERIQKKNKLSKKDKRTLESLATQYRIDNITAKDSMAVISELLLRIDVIPVSLVLAQAAKESGWGSSRFARQGNNIFGLRTLSNNGIVPFYRGTDRVFKISLFDDLQSCVNFYMFTINTHPAYEELRYIRSAMARPSVCTLQAHSYDSIALAQGLNRFSERGSVYAKEIQDLIKHNRLERYDRCKLTHRMGIWGFKQGLKWLKDLFRG
ncbi:MAG: glucosaminidase domain-containing protein [Deltaproteobacteria bacterium]|nr:glucosaminidase domain-containing protein [Deltaproteobacteria bacterium]